MIWSFAGSGSPALEIAILLVKIVQLSLQLLNLCHVLVLDPEIVHFDLDVADLRAKLVLFLRIADDGVEHTLEVLDLVIDLLDLLVLGLFEDSLLHFLVN